MLIHVGLLDAMLGPYSCNVELILSQERRVPLSLYPAQKEHMVFGSCWDQVGRCWAYMEPMLACVDACWELGNYLGAMFEPFWAYLEPRLACYPRPKRNALFLDHVGAMLGDIGRSCGL